MRLTLPRTHAGGAVLATLATWLLLTAGVGCSRSACFVYTKGEYAQHHDRCPAQKDALANFSDPQCPGSVVAVDSEGDFDGELCCYTVTYDDVTPDCGETGVGGGFGGSGAGGFGPSPTCSTCGEQLVGASTNENELCDESLASWKALEACACTEASCSTSCGASLCDGVAPTAACLACLQDGSRGCTSALVACEKG